MLRRRLVVPILLLLAVLGLSGALYAQLETADRGILPLDSSGTLDIGGIHVDVGGADAQSARFAGWRIAQRQGFRALWAKMHHAPIEQAPNLPDGTLDQIVSSINVEREEIGPNRYIADLGILFDRARAAPFLGVEGGEISRSQPMLLIPITITAGTETSVELKKSVAARLGPVPHLAKSDRLRPGERDGRGSNAGERRSDHSPRARLVAQLDRPVRRRRHPGRRGPDPARLSRRSRRGPLHRPPRPGQSDCWRVHADRGEQRRTFRR